MTSEGLVLYKLMILYMLDRVDFPLTGSQISQFILDKGYTTYFNLQIALNELIENDSSKISLIKLQSEEDKHEELNTQTEINFFGCDMDEDYNKNNVSFTLEDEKQQQFFF